MDSLTSSAIASAGVSGLASIGSSLLGISSSREAEDRAYRRNLDLMRQQNDFNVDMWNRQNSYNAPVNQLNLLKEAGINPAMYDFKGAGATAGEVTSAGASVPYNSEIANHYQGLGSAVEKTISALTADAQISKLRSEIALNRLNLQDAQARYDANIELWDMPGSSESYDEDGNVVTVFAPRRYNRYQEQRANERLDISGKAQQQDFTADQMEVYRATKDILKQMPAQQLRSLAEDIRSKALNNELTAEDVRFMKEYGISSNDQNIWTTLIRASLHNPEAVANMIERLADALGRSGGRIAGDLIDRFTAPSHANPVRKSSW